MANTDQNSRTPFLGGPEGQRFRQRENHLHPFTPEVDTIKIVNQLHEAYTSGVIYMHSFPERQIHDNSTVQYVLISPTDNRNRTGPELTDWARNIITQLTGHRVDRNPDDDEDLDSEVVVFEQALAYTRVVTTRTFCPTPHVDPSRLQTMGINPTPHETTTEDYSTAVTALLVIEVYPNPETVQNNLDERSARIERVIDFYSTFRQDNSQP